MPSDLSGRYDTASPMPYCREHASLWLGPDVSVLEGCINNNKEGRVLFSSSFTSLSSIPRFFGVALYQHTVLHQTNSVSDGIAVIVAIKCNFQVMHRNASCVFCKLEFSKFYCLALKSFLHNVSCNLGCWKHRVGLISSKREIKHCQFVSLLAVRVE